MAADHSPYENEIGRWSNRNSRASIPMFNRKLYVFPVYERNGTAQKLCRVLWTLRKIIAAVRTARQTKNSAENQLKKKKNHGNARNEIAN